MTPNTLLVGRITGLSSKLPMVTVSYGCSSWKFRGVRAAPTYPFIWYKRPMDNTSSVHQNKTVKAPYTALGNSVGKQVGTVQEFLGLLVITHHPTRRLGVQ